MMRKFLLAFAFVFSCVQSSFAVYSGGSGSSSSPYILATENDLVTFRDRVNNKSDDTGSYYVISTDAAGFQMTKYSTWTPIGTSTNSFTGHLNGRGKTIYVNINKSSSSAFFGTIGSGASVSNLNIEGSVRSNTNASGFALTLDGGTIKDCRFSGNIYVTDSSSSSIAENLNAGGLVDYMNSGTIEDCSFNGEMKVDGGVYPRAGGIVSLMHGGSIKDCFVSHYSSVESYASSGAGTEQSAIAGGIAGQVNIGLTETIEGCEFRGEVTAKSSNTSYAGGIVGYMRGGTLKDNSVLDDSVISGRYTAGGIAGFLRTGGTVDGNTVEAGSVVTAETYSAGGIIGILDLGTVTNNTSHASITGNASIKGGIIGKVTPATSSPATRIISGNTYSGADYGIGSDASGSPGDEGAEHTDSSFYITTSAQLTSGKIYTSYSQTFETNVSSDSAVWIKVSGEFPSGLTLSGNTLSGTPTETGTFEFTLRASVYSSYSSSGKTFSLTIDSQLNIITSSNLSSGTTGHSYGPVTLRTDADDGSYVTWTASGLPNGLSLGNLTGILSGTPTTAGYYTFTVTAQSGSYTAKKDFTITITSSLSITTDSTLPSGSMNSAYSVTLESSVSDSENVIWSRISGTLPEGLTLSESGTISGTPKVSGTFSFIVRASVYGTEYTDSKEFYITIDSTFSIITESSELGYAKMNQYYAHDLMTNADDPDSVLWSVTGGSLPEGMYLASYTGRIYGTPVKAGYYEFTVQAISGGITAEKELILMVRPTLSIITSSDLPSGIINQAYSYDIETDAEASNIVEWSFISGDLPAGISFDESSGRLYGTPSKAGTYTFTIGAATGSYKAENKEFTLKILPSLSITTSSPLTNAKVSHEYSVNISATPIQDEIYTWSVTGGTLPDGLTVNESTSSTSTLTISGTPITAGTYTFTVQVNAAGMTVSKEFTLTIDSLITITTDTLPDGKMNHSYSYTLSADAETSAFITWSVSGGSLPQGLNLGSYTGAITGIPSESGYFTFTVKASAGSISSEREFGITISPAISILTSSDLPYAVINTQYSQILECDAGEGNVVTWTYYGTLPGGLTLDSSAGIISGIPVREGTYTFRIEASTGTLTVSKDFTLAVRPELYIMTDSELPSVKVLHEYSVTLTASSTSEGAASWSLLSGDMPAGLTLNESTGIISGTPTEEGMYAFTIQVTVNGRNSVKEFTLEVRPSLYITTSSPLPSVKEGSTYEVVLSTDIDSDMIVTWSVISGNLPDGLTLRENTGVISGIPDTEGTYVFVIEAKAGLLESSKTFILTVKPALSIITDNELPDSRPNESYSLKLETDAESSDIVKWKFISGDLPEGFTFGTDTGTLTGISSREGIYEFTIGAEVQTTARRLSAQKNFVLAVRPPMFITTYEIYTIDAGSDFTLTLETDSKDSHNIIWSVISGDVPSGMTLNNDGVIAGIPSRAGTFTFTVQALSGYALAKKDFTFTIGLVISSASYLHNGTKGESYSEVLKVIGAGSTEWYLVSGPLPAGLNLSSQGIISGIPSTEGTYNFIVHASDAEGNSAQKLMRITIDSASTLPITTSSLPSGKAGEDYYAVLYSSVSGVTWSITEGRLPNGLTLNSSNGLIEGVPSEAGTFTFTVKASYGQREGTRRFTVWIEAADVIVSDDESGNVSSGSSGGGGCSMNMNLIMIFIPAGLIFRRRH